MGRDLGYARVSTTGQDETMQVDAMLAKGIERRDIYVDRGVSGSRASRPDLDRLLRDIQPGDTLTVWKLDRLGRNTAHLVTLLNDLTQRSITIRSVQDGLDSSTPPGRAMMQILAIFAELERSFMLERTRSGLAIAAANGRKGGRPRALDTKKARLAQRLYDEREPVKEIADTLGVSVATVYRYLNSGELIAR